MNITEEYLMNNDMDMDYVINELDEMEEL